MVTWVSIMWNGLQLRMTVSWPFADATSHIMWLTVLKSALCCCLPEHLVSSDLSHSSCHLRTQTNQNALYPSSTDPSSSPSQEELSQLAIRLKTLKLTLVLSADKSQIASRAEAESVRVCVCARLHVFCWSRVLQQKDHNRGGDLTFYQIMKNNRHPDTLVQIERVITLP